MPRTENDTWNLATSVGATATMVAAARAIATKARQPLIDDRFRRTAGPCQSGWTSSPAGSAATSTRLTSTSTSRAGNFSTCRTRWPPDPVLRRLLQDATQAGIRQAVILASGLDAAPTLAWPADMTYSRSTSRVIEFKTRTLAGLGAARKPTCVRSPSICGRMPTALREAGLDKNGRLRGLPRALGYLRLRLRTHCWKTSPRSVRRAAGFACGSRPGQARGRQRTTRQTMRQGSAKWLEHGLEWTLQSSAYQASATTSPPAADLGGAQSVLDEAAAGRPSPGSDPENSAGVSVAEPSTTAGAGQMTTAARPGSSRRDHSDVECPGPLYDTVCAAVGLPSAARRGDRAAGAAGSPGSLTSACGTEFSATGSSGRLRPTEIYGVDMSDGIAQPSSGQIQPGGYLHGPPSNFPSRTGADAVVTTSAFSLLDQRRHCGNSIVCWRRRDCGGRDVEFAAHLLQVRRPSNGNLSTTRRRTRSGMFEGAGSPSPTAPCPGPVWTQLVST